MTKFRDTYLIESARLPEYDYSNPNWYYVTINTKNHTCWFGDVKSGKMILNEMGRIVKKCWTEVPNHYSAVELDYYVIMPNHVHGIIIINKVETGHAPSLHNPTLSNVVGSFKSAVTKSAREINCSDFAWQPRFYDHIIRTEKELYQIRNYIEQNPLRWDLEKELPSNLD